MVGGVARQVVQQALDSAGLEKADIDWLLLHQANQRILDSAAQRLGVPPVRTARPRPTSQRHTGVAQRPAESEVLGEGSPLLRQAPSSLLRGLKVFRV